MKTSINVFVAFAFISVASAAVTPNVRVQEICGDLGVMDVATNELASGVGVSDIRMCADHPLGRNRTLDEAEGASLAPVDPNDAHVLARTPSSLNTLEERSCNYKAPYGCSGGYCWKSCGKNGVWCWTASKGGVGAWAKCSKFEDCGTVGIYFGCGKACASCGCSC